MDTWANGVPTECYQREYAFAAFFFRAVFFSFLQSISPLGLDADGRSSQACNRYCLVPRVALKMIYDIHIACLHRLPACIDVCNFHWVHGEICPIMYHHVHPLYSGQAQQKPSMLQALASSEYKGRKLLISVSGCHMHMRCYSITMGESYVYSALPILLQI